MKQTTQNQDYEFILENLDEAIWLFSASGKLLYRNQAAGNMQSCREQEICDCCDNKFFLCPLQGRQDECLLGQTLRDSKPHQVDRRCGDKEYCFKTTPLFDETGKLIRVLRRAVDITERNMLATNEKVARVCLEKLMEPAFFVQSIEPTLQIIRDYLRADFAFLLRYENDQFLSTYSAVTRPDAPESWMPHPGKAVLEPKCEWLQSFSLQGVLTRNGLSETEIRFLRSCLGMADFPDKNSVSLHLTPILINDVLWGNLGIIHVSDQEPTRLSPLAQQFLIQSAEVFQFVIGRKNNQDQMNHAILTAESHSHDEHILNECFAEIMPEQNASASFAKLLKHFCHYFGADHCFLNSFDEESNEIEVLEEYSGDGNSSTKWLKRRMPLDLTSDWFKQLSQHQVLTYDDKDKTSHAEESEQWGEYFKHGSVKKMYFVPIFYEGKLWGSFALSFEHTHVIFSEQHIRLLHSFCNMLEIILMRQQYLADLSDALEKAKAATKAKSEFLATMSHELRTPLNSVIGFSELLSLPNLPDSDVKEYVHSINVAGKALLQLINDILDFSKIESGHMIIVPVPTDLHALFDDLKLIFTQSAINRGLYMKFIIPDSMPILQLDEMRLKQILLNLIGNALKFTPSGGVTVTARYEETNGSLSILVSDTGIGIEKEKQSLIFDPFVQQDALRDSRIYQGTGLGLAICAKLCQRMGGTIQVTSSPGQGSEFSVNLTGLTKVEKSEQSNSMAHAQDISGIPTKMRVLIVDDVPLNVKVLKAMCEKLNLSAQTADSGKEALRLLNEEDFDLLLTDLWMPEMNGVELIQEYRKLKKKPNLKTVVVSADAELSQKIFKEFDGFLLKPVTLNKFSKLLLGLWAPTPSRRKQTAD